MPSHSSACSSSSALVASAAMSRPAAAEASSLEAMPCLLLSIAALLTTLSLSVTPSASARRAARSRADSTPSMRARRAARTCEACASFSRRAWNREKGFSAQAKSRCEPSAKAAKAWEELFRCVCAAAPTVSPPVRQSPSPTVAERLSLLCCVDSRFCWRRRRRAWFR